MKNIYLAANGNYEGVTPLNVIESVLDETPFDCSAYSAIIVTSKTTVEWLKNFAYGITNQKIFAVGEKTAASLEQKGFSVFYIPTQSYGDVLAQEISEKYPDERYIYFRPLNVVSSICQQLEEKNIYCEEAIIYKTHCVQSGVVMKKGVVIFTSPSSVSCFGRFYSWKKVISAVVIGKKTASDLPFKVAYAIAPKATIEACITLAKEFVCDVMKKQNAKKFIKHRYKRKKGL